MVSKLTVQPELLDLHLPSAGPGLRTWLARNELLAEWTVGYPVRKFEYECEAYPSAAKGMPPAPSRCARGMDYRMTAATIFTQTTRFTYDGDGRRLQVLVEGQGSITYTLDYVAGGRAA